MGTPHNRGLKELYVPYTDKELKDLAKIWKNSPLSSPSSSRSNSPILPPPPKVVKRHDSWEKSGWAAAEGSTRKRKPSKKAEESKKTNRSSGGRKYKKVRKSKKLRKSKKVRRY
uniref:Uncharacterized protein n=1 Tax=viral metagenome TaxID=1070528 RepID=A0A6C0AXE1_9ZZZZ|tara:strand:- start:1742 stop:2083 length:342 start_codon:yes stop_codon:yes gene_type:complete